MKFIVKSSINPNLVYCQDRQFHSESLVGPGGYAAKIYKQKLAATKVRNGQGIIVEEYNEQ